MFYLRQIVFYQPGDPMSSNPIRAYTSLRSSGLTPSVCIMSVNTNRPPCLRIRAASLTASSLSLPACSYESWLMTKSMHWSSSIDSVNERSPLMIILSVNPSLAVISALTLFSSAEIFTQDTLQQNLLAISLESVP